MFAAVSQECRETTIYFRNGKHKLKKDQIGVLNDVLQSLDPDTTYLIELHGHTDDRGSEEDNLNLSKLRVQIVREVMSKMTDKKIRLFNLHFGELNPVSNDKRLNRRVNILIRPINEDGTITLYGNDAVQMRIPVGYFQGCGYCLSNPSLESTMPAENGLDGTIKVNIANDCVQNIECFSVEFRFPYEYFNESAEVKVPQPIYARFCGSPVQSKDSINVKADSNFEIRFDTLTNEYIVTHDCFYPSDICLCGTRGFTVKYKAILPPSLDKKSSFYYIKLANEPDSLILETRDTFFLNGANMLYGIGFSNGNPVFLEEEVSTFQRKVIYTEKGFYDYTECYVSEGDYHPLNYKDTIVQLKLPIGIKAKFPGYFIGGFDYFISFEQIKHRKFIRNLLDYPFQFAIKDTSNDFTEVIPKEQLKIHHKKRKKLIKVKVKRSFFRTLTF